MGSYGSSNIETHIGLRLISPDGVPAPVSATLHYAGADPYAVHVVFHLRRTLAEINTTSVTSGQGSSGSVSAASVTTEPADVNGDISWTFSRELLADGLKHPAGYGDVRIWPWNSSGGRSVALALSSPDGYALFEAPRSVMETFLDRCYGCVPAGLEEQYVDIDSSLADLLGAPDADAR